MIPKFYHEILQLFVADQKLDGGSLALQNVGILQHNYMISQPRRPCYKINQAINKSFH